MNNFSNKWPLYMIVDGAKVDSELSELLRKASKYACLYRGESEKNMASVAPYLAVIEKGCSLPDFVHATGNQQAWGVFVDADADMEVLVFHFRKFLIVETEESKQMYFRFYDPRVLRAFLPTCNESQLLEFFGPVDFFYCEAVNPDQTIKFSIEHKKLKVDYMDRIDFLGAILNESSAINAQVNVQEIPKHEDKKSMDQYVKKGRSFVYKS